MTGEAPSGSVDNAIRVQLRVSRVPIRQPFRCAVVGLGTIGRQHAAVLSTVRDADLPARSGATWVTQLVAYIELVAQLDLEQPHPA